MICENCPVKDFVFADLYCQDCRHKPKPDTVTGTAYLYRRNKLLPVESVVIESPENRIYETAALELMREFRIEFVGD